VAGPKYAGSPFAFNTIGSTLAVNAFHYAKVRGFPRREAGEDFYLLNKLAKVGSVLEMDAGADCEPIEIESRRSDRVPFGTGAAVTRIADLRNPEADFRFYHPGVFELLKTWLASWPGIWQSRSTDLEAMRFQVRSGVGASDEKLRVLRAALRQLKTSESLDHAFRQSSSLDQFTRQMHTWFDAFRTLKLIHILRDHGFSSVSYAALREDQSFVCLDSFFQGGVFGRGFENENREGARTRLDLAVDDDQGTADQLID
jgi:hypothetical protein